MGSSSQVVELIKVSDIIQDHKEINLRSKADGNSSQVMELIKLCDSIQGKEEG
jgi:hypothetical protein